MSTLRSTTMHRILLVALSVMLSPGAAHAQSAPGVPDPARVRVRVGALWMNPSFSLINAGVDNNVFNDPDAADPKRDFNVTMRPQAELWLRMGRTWVTSLLREDIVWYKTYSSERSGNSTVALGWVVPLTRLSFNASGAWLSTRERPGFEIDSRSQRHQLNFNSSIEITALSKTFVGFRIDRTKVDFDEEATFEDVNLHDELNRTGTTATVTFRHLLTPLTSLTAEVTKGQDRFEFSPLRDSDSTMVTFGVKFDPLALITGSAQFGFRNFDPASADVPGYEGSTALVSLTYVAGGATKLTMSASRDVQYSFDVDQPYYLQTGWTGSVAQQIYGPLDVEGRIGRQSLAYRTREGTTVDVVDRVDHVRSYGIGVGYHLGREIRIAFNVDNQDRESDVTDRRYEGLRFGSAVTYGF